MPIGTLVYEKPTDPRAAACTLLADLAEEGERVLVAQGRPRRPRQRALRHVHQPRAAQGPAGRAGRDKDLRLELKLLADVGLVGFPNAGKSTLIARISAARPKIADYPFTTLTPNLGVVRLSDDRSFVVADVPGLIEGAHRGLGLGHQFLRHLERTKVLVHLVDVSGATGRDPVDDLDTVRKELELFQPTLAAKPQIVAANKMDARRRRHDVPSPRSSGAPRSWAAVPAGLRRHRRRASRSCSKRCGSGLAGARGQTPPRRHDAPRDASAFSAARSTRFTAAISTSADAAQQRARS